MTEVTRQADVTHPRVTPAQIAYHVEGTITTPIVHQNDFALVFEAVQDSFETAVGLLERFLFIEDRKNERENWLPYLSLVWAGGMAASSVSTTAVFRAKLFMKRS